MARRYFRASDSGAYAMKIGDHTWWLTADPYPRWEQRGYSLYMRYFERINFDPLERFQRDLREAHADNEPLRPVYDKYRVTPPRI